MHHHDYWLIGASSSSTLSTLRWQKATVQRETLISKREKKKRETESTGEVQIWRIDKEKETVVWHTPTTIIKIYSEILFVLMNNSSSANAH